MLKPQMNTNKGVSDVSFQDKYDECISSTLKIRQEIIVSGSIFITLTALLLIFEIFLTIKVCRLVWTNDKVVPLMLALLCFSLFSIISFYSFEITEVQYPEWSCSDTKGVLCPEKIM